MLAFLLWKIPMAAWRLVGRIWWTIKTVTTLQVLCLVPMVLALLWLPRVFMSAEEMQQTWAFRARQLFAEMTELQPEASDGTVQDHVFAGGPDFGSATVSQQ